MANSERYIICKGESSLEGKEKNVYIFQPLFNNDESVPLFYRNNIDCKNKINIDIISANINASLEGFKSYKISEVPDIEDISIKIKEKYKDISNNDILKYFELIKKGYHEIYFGSSVDELSYEEKKVLIEYIIKEKYKEKKLSSEKFSVIKKVPKWIKEFSYNYLKNNFIYQSGTKFSLFEHDKKPIGYMIMNEGKQKNSDKQTKSKLEYIPLSDTDKNDLMQNNKQILSGIIDSIKDKGDMFKMNKMYISPYYNIKAEDNNFIYTYKLYNAMTERSRGNIIGNNTAFILSLIHI